MRKRIPILLFTIMFSLCVTVSAVDNDNWNESPVITNIYESGKEQLIVEWEGNSDLYQVYVDGKNVSTVNLNNAVLDVKAGRHQIQIIPIKLESKGVDTNIELGLWEISGSIDLAALGVDPKDIVQGNRSEAVPVTYAVNPVLSAVPEISAVVTDFDNQVVLSFKDKYNSDLYKVGIKSGKDVNYIEFDVLSAQKEGLLTKNNSSVTIVLDQQYLKQNGCMIPELDEKYGFSVTLEKYAINLIDKTPVISMSHCSKESKFLNYTPVAAWKTAPEIIYASQTADGQITLRWEHKDGGLGCKYEVIEITKTLGIKKSTKLIGTYTKKETVIEDLMNGSHTYSIIPVYSGQIGDSSENVTVKVKNDWVAAPALECSSLSGNRILLSWPSAVGIESYHITVYASDGSLLRYINLDFKKYTEFDVPATLENMEYIFSYGKDIVSDNGIKLKFEIYGLRHTANGSEQQSAVSKQIILVN